MRAAPVLSHAHTARMGIVRNLTGYHNAKINLRHQICDFDMDGIDAINTLPIAERERRLIHRGRAKKVLSLDEEDKLEKYAKAKRSRTRERGFRRN